MTLAELERDVEAARGRLAADLSVLRSPATLSEFGESLKRDAMQAKDSLLENLKRDAMQAKESTILNLVDGVKARAAANPVAVLLIGAGVAWRIIRHPPIATALVGAGLYSFLRSKPLGPQGQPDTEYIEQAKVRLREQTNQLTSAARMYAAESAMEVKEQAKDLARTAGLKAQRLTTEVRNKTSVLPAGFVEATGATPMQLSDGFAAGAAAGERVLTDSQLRDKFLFAVAGIFVAAAFGIASQRH